MSEITFKGEFEEGHPSRVSSDGLNGSIHIGGEDVIDRVQELDGNLRVTLNGEVLSEGASVWEFGSGYSSWTPMEDDAWSVGGKDMIDVIRANVVDGENVLVIEEVEG